MGVSYTCRTKSNAQQTTDNLPFWMLINKKWQKQPHCSGLLMSCGRQISSLFACASVISKSKRSVRMLLLIVSTMWKWSGCGTTDSNAMNHILYTVKYTTVVVSAGYYIWSNQHVNYRISPEVKELQSCIYIHTYIHTLTLEVKIVAGKHHSFMASCPQALNPEPF